MVLESHGLKGFQDKSMNLPKRFKNCFFGIKVVLCTYCRSRVILIFKKKPIGPCHICGMSTWKELFNFGIGEETINK